MLADAEERVVLLDGDEFWRVIRRGRMSPWLPESHDQNTAVVRILATTAAGYAAAGYPVIVDGIVGPWFLPVFTDATREAGVALHYVVLRASLAVALERVADRNVGVVDAGFEAGIRHMWRQFSDLGALERHVVDTSATPADVVGRQVADGYRSDVFRVLR